MAWANCCLTSYAQQRPSSASANCDKLPNPCALITDVQPTSRLFSSVDWQSFQATADPLSAATAWVPIPKSEADTQPLIAAHSVTVAKMRIFVFFLGPHSEYFSTNARRCRDNVTIPVFTRQRKRRLSKALDQGTGLNRRRYQKPGREAIHASAQVKPVCEFLQTHGPGKLRHRSNPLLPSLSQTLPTFLYATARHETAATLHSQKDFRAPTHNPDQSRILRNRRGSTCEPAPRICDFTPRRMTALRTLRSLAWAHHFLALVSPASGHRQSDRKAEIR